LRFFTTIQQIQFFIPRFHTMSDLEKDAGNGAAHLTNQSVHSFSWEDITVTVKDRQSKQPLQILSGINGIVKAGMSKGLHGVHID
jgi:hypothetical protein